MARLGNSLTGLENNQKLFYSFLVLENGPIYGKKLNLGWTPLGLDKKPSKKNTPKATEKKSIKSFPQTHHQNDPINFLGNFPSKKQKQKKCGKHFI
jgi:hypothetical protein